MSRKLAFAVAAALLAAALHPLAALAGWKIQEVDPEFPDEATTYRFQGGKVRVDGALEGLVVVVDLRKDEGWLIDTGLKRYAGGKIADLAEQLKKLENEGLPEDEALREEDAGAAAGPGKVEVKDLGPGERILGFETRRHQVFLDGELLEELWLAPKVDVEREANPTAFASALQKMLGGGAGVDQGYESDPAYAKVRTAGYPLRQVLYFVGEKSSLEVKSAEQAPVADAEFAVPAGFARVGYAELLVGEGAE